MDNDRSALISVIIPAYNVGKYIDRCLRSIEQQSYGIDNLEIILIDDASTDDTLAHLEAFEAKHPDVTVLIKSDKNQGQGVARNIGLDYASGEYITFIDSDDMIDFCMLEKMASKIRSYDCDVVECGHMQFSTENEAMTKEDLDEPFFLDLQNVDSRRKLIVSTCSKTSVWGRLYKKDFLSKNELRFTENIFFEDIPFSGLVMFMASSYYRINETLYYYFSNNSGTVFSSYKKDRICQEVTATERFLGELYDRGMLDHIIENYRNELSVYCTTKAFIDPLTLLINSSLGLNVILREIEYFKGKLIDLFPDAGMIYNLSDEHGICGLGIHLLSSDTSLTESLFKDAVAEDNIIINVSGDTKPSPDALSALTSVISDIAEDNSINITQTHYSMEHLLIRHAIDKSNTITILADKYSSPGDQFKTTRQICSVIDEYPCNRIILMLENLYYNETDECLCDFSRLMARLTSHSSLTIVLRDENAYSIGCVLMPSVDIRLI